MHLIGPSLRGGSLEDLSPAGLFWEGGGWPCGNAGFFGVFFHRFTDENVEIRAVCRSRPRIQSQETAAEDRSLERHGLKRPSVPVEGVRFPSVPV